MVAWWGVGVWLRGCGEGHVALEGGEEAAGVGDSRDFRHICDRFSVKRKKVSLKVIFLWSGMKSAANHQYSQSKIVSLGSALSMDGLVNS